MRDRVDSTGQHQFTANCNGGVLVRANRAKRIEEISYRLTDLVTIVSGLMDILSDKVPSIDRQDLQAIRNTAIKGAEFSKQLLVAVRDCRREIGM